LDCSKHPADVPFKKSSGHARHIECPHTLKTFLKKCYALFEKSKCHRNLSTTPLKQLAKTKNAGHITLGSSPEPPEKHGMPVREKRWERSEILRDKTKL
jgi:hypothetical protein